MGEQERIGGFNVLAVLGYGASSTIYAVQDPKDSQLYALKRVTKRSSSDQKFLDQAENEYEIARQIDHPIIRKVYSLKKKRSPLLTVNELYILMEFVDGRALVQERPEQLRDLVRVFVATAEGLHAMHKRQFVHADMKPNNIVVCDDGSVKVIDLGQSCPIGTVKERIQGTPDYIAPEQVRLGPLTARTDVFNFGATMYWCVTDKHVPTMIPKSGNDIGLVSDMELRAPRDLNPEVPPALNNLILNCLETSPEDRPATMAEVKVRLEVVLNQLQREAPPK
jgi:serine/threonine-protein kinase